VCIAWPTTAPAEIDTIAGFMPRPEQYRKNPAHYRRYARKYYREHRAERIVKQRAYYLKNRHKKAFRKAAVARVKAWTLKHPRRTRAMHARYYQHHRAHLKEKARSYYRANRKHCLEVAKRWRQKTRANYRKWFKRYMKDPKNRSKRHQMQSKYRKANLAKIKASKKRAYERRRAHYIKQAALHSKTKKGRITRQAATARRRARLKNNGGNLSPKQWNRKLEKYQHRCARCGRNRKLHMHHIKPLADEGRNTIRNVIPLCEPCHFQTHRELKAARKTAAMRAPA
jgi:hypothetical protein